jgi:hypothetical protein
MIEYIRQLSWSSNNRYLLVSSGISPWDYGGSGFTIDTQIGEQREICEEGYHFGRGYWIENTNLLLYTMYSETNTKLELLDVSTWESQDIMELNPDNFVNYIGWTPITIP